MNKFLIFVCAGFMLISGQFTAQENGMEGDSEAVDASLLYVPYKESKTSWGFKKGNQVVIPAKFEYVTHFSEGYALVKSNGKWGYIDPGGEWYIQPEYDKGQPFQNGVAFVKKGSKTGLIGSDKRVIIEPVYDNIREDYRLFYLINDGKFGFLSLEHPEFPPIPTIYDSISYFNADISSGKNADGSWDIYYQGKKTIEKADQPVTYKNHQYSQDMVVVSLNGKYGVYSLPSGWILEPKYGMVESLEFPDYRVKGKDASTIFALHDQDLAAIDPEYMYNEELKDSITLAKINGELISPLKFNSIDNRYERYSEVQAPYAIEMSRNGKTYQLYNNFKIRELNFSNAVSHNYNNYYIADAVGVKQYILDANFAVIDSFYHVEKYLEYTQDFENSIEIIDPETGDYLYEPNFIEKAVEEPFLVVYRETGGKVEKALYDLQGRKVMSPWFDGDQAITVHRSGIGGDYGNYDSPPEILYTYYPEMDYGNMENNAGKKMGYYVYGMKTGTEMMYHIDNDTPPITGNLFVMHTGDPEKPVHHLFRYANEQVELVSSEYQVEESANLYGTASEYNYDAETSETNWDYVSTNFTHNFLVLKKDGKFGVCCFNGTVIKPQYDTLMQNTSLDFVINTMLGDKYGTIDLVRGYEIKPQLDSEPYINSDMYSGSQTIYNTSIYSESGSYMLDLRGKKFYGNPDMTFPRKVKNKYGLYAYSGSDLYHDAFEQVKPQFKYLEQSPIQSLFLAKGKNKKWGIINFIGDTLVPVKYDKIRLFNYNGDNYFLLEVSNKNKKGLYDLKRGEIVPAKYDEINMMGDYDIFYDLYEVKSKGKSGVINRNGKEILPPVYDEVRIANDYGTYVVGTKGKKTVAYLIAENQNPVALREYDFIASGSGYIRSGEQFEVYSLMNGELEKNIPMNDLVINGNLYNIIMQNGKFGAADHEGRVLVPCTYDFASFMEFRDEVMIGYQDGVKYYIYVENNERFTEQQW